MLISRNKRCSSKEKLLDQGQPWQSSIFPSHIKILYLFSLDECNQKLFVFLDEYTRITTPRQDVLFKKGYLNKPKTYHNQTSTGNSTISTGNSTENGTPDHQSAGKSWWCPKNFKNSTKLIWYCFRFRIRISICVSQWFCRPKRNLLR